MKITLLTIGKTDQKYITQGINMYLERLKHYISFEIKEIPSLKKTGAMPAEHIKQKEAELLLKHLDKADCIILLDEKGKNYSSKEFSEFLSGRMNAATREMVFVVGGAWGFAESIYQKAHYKISLSRMTFSHQMVRLFFTEQLYRAFTIIRGEGYHNE
jgi:23S rRNA (pseudouridine1915-N3)-methyltransferase